jgi:GT2 family glycosyltransferase
LRTNAPTAALFLRIRSVSATFLSQREKPPQRALLTVMSTVADTAPQILAPTAPEVDRPDLSVIVVTHNRPELALLTLRTARAAIRELTVQWIVVDSGSSDGTPETIAAAYPDVELLREQNIGFAAANNRGLQLVRGRYVLLLNPDVETTTGTYDELVATLDARPEIGVASVVQNNPDGSLQHSIRRFPSPSLAFGEALAASRWTPLRRWREEEPRAPLYRTDVPVDWLVGAFLIARANALAQVGGLDERFFLYSEETDWCFRFHRAGWQVAHLPVMAVTHHTGHAPRADLCAQLSYAKVLFARKHYGRARTVAIRAALALRHALRVAAGAVLGRVRPEQRARAAAERHALAVVLGLAEPPFARTQTSRS